MPVATVQARLTALLRAELGEDPESGRPIDPRATFNDLGLDSLDITSFLLQVEGAFGVTIRKDELAALSSIEAIEQYLAARGL